jgi:hypothetical protein
MSPVNQILFFLQKDDNDGIRFGMLKMVLEMWKKRKIYWGVSFI